MESDPSDPPMPPPPPPSDGPGDDAPPPPPPAARPGYLASPRYAYLAGRLRDRRITMEEATELFGILQDALATLSAARAVPPPRAGTRPTRSAGPPRPYAISDDDLGLGLVAFGAGAGLLAAILKRSSEGPKAPAPK